MWFKKETGKKEPLSDAADRNKRSNIFVKGVPLKIKNQIFVLRLCMETSNFTVIFLLAYSLQFFKNNFSMLQEAATVSQSKASSDSQLQVPNGPATDQSPSSGPSQPPAQQQQQSSSSQAGTQGTPQSVPSSVPPQGTGAPPRTPPVSLSGLGELTQSDLSGLVEDGAEDDPEDLFQQLGDSHFELDNFLMAEFEEKVRQAAEPNFKVNRYLY